MKLELELSDDDLIIINQAIMEQYNKTMAKGVMFDIGNSNDSLWGETFTFMCKEFLKQRKMYEMFKEFINLG